MTIAPKSDAGRALVGVTLSMLALSWVTVITRIWVRRWIKALGADDWLMVAGLVLFTVSAQNILNAVCNGVGTPDIYLDAETEREGRKWFWVCSTVYPFSSLAIKCSICTALLRIAKHRKYRYPLYAIMILSAIASLSTTITLLAWCRPIPANWDARAGTCPNPVILSNISYYLSANSILTDWACAILPVLLLWDIQLKRRIKASIILLLALGVIASLATIARLASFTAYTSPVNYMPGLAKIAIWSMLECGIGIVAGSIATFRPLFRFVAFLSQSSYANQSGALHGRVHQLNDVSCTHLSVGPGCGVGVVGGVEWSDVESERYIVKEVGIEVGV